jgi:hypothetical protein
MTKIAVDKNVLKTMRDNLDYLLENGKQSFTIDTHQIMYENHDLNRKEQIIIDHLNKNPGINKEKAASDLKDDYARITILDAINGLIEKGLVIARKDKIKKRTYNLYVNYQNIISSLKTELDAFKAFYCQLLDFVSPIIKNLLLKNQRSKKRLSKVCDLLNALIGPYKYLCIMYITSDVFLWHKRPLDDDTLHRKFAIFFKTTKEIHAKLLKIWPDSGFKSIVSEMLYSSSFGLDESHILHMLKTFEEYGLKGWSEPVLDVLWKISYPILPLIDPSYNKCLENGTLDDWRKVLENNPQSNYKPKTEQLPFDQ